MPSTPCVQTDWGENKGEDRLGIERKRGWRVGPTCEWKVLFYSCLFVTAIDLFFIMFFFGLIFFLDSSFFLMFSIRLAFVFLFLLLHPVCFLAFSSCFPFDLCFCYRHFFLPFSISTQRDEHLNHWSFFKNQYFYHQIIDVVLITNKTFFKIRISQCSNYRTKNKNFQQFIV